MQQATLEANATTSGGGSVIRLRGEIDGSARIVLNDAYDAAAGPAGLELDFTDVVYINSTGIALIVGLLARARSDQRPVSARGLSQHYREIFEITRLSDFMTILADEQSAPNAAQEEAVQ